jgi:hypothetical protein
MLTILLANFFLLYKKTSKGVPSCSSKEKERKEKKIHQANSFILFF